MRPRSAVPPVLVRSPSRTALAVSLLAGLAFPACASLKPPTLRVQNLGVGSVGVTGASLHVTFGVRNPNPEDLVIERFEYDLVLNGQRLGRGYVSEPVALRGFAEERVSSQFNLNFLSLPGTVKALLEKDRARARVRGDFYVREGDALKKLGFDSEAEVDLGR